MSKSSTRFLDEVAETFVKGLKDKSHPLLKDWLPGEFKPPYNPSTGQRYHGINFVNLSGLKVNDPRWLTYDQSQKMGWQVRQGEQGERGVYWATSQRRLIRDGSNKPILDKAGKKQYEVIEFDRPRCSVFTLFNAGQMDNVPLLGDPEPLIQQDKAQAMLDNSQAVIKNDQNDRAFHHRIDDEIHLPARSQFVTEESYLAVALHELGHWTGHPTRLDREIGESPFGSIDYYSVGNHQTYINNWISILNDDPGELMRAAADAEKINAYVLELAKEKTMTQSNDAELTYRVQAWSTAEGRWQTYKEDSIDSLDQAESLADTLLTTPEAWDGSVQPKVSILDSSGERTFVLQASVDKVVTEHVIPNKEKKKETPEKRVYLSIPYKDKEFAKKAAKDAGYRIGWDKERELWFAPTGVDIAPLVQWLPKNQKILKPTVEYGLLPYQEFSEALKDMGLILEGDPCNGQVILATGLELIQNCRSASFGDNPSL